MDFEIIRNYCLQKPGTSEDLPFDQDTLVIRVGTKILFRDAVEIYKRL